MAKTLFLRMRCKQAFTLIEAMMGAAIVAIVGAALVGAVIGQSSLNLTARNLTAAMSDATRVMEEIRQQNTHAACASGIPSAVPPDNRTSWNQWLDATKSIPINAVTPFELVAVTCQDASAIICHAGDSAQCPDGEIKTCPVVASDYPLTCSDGSKVVLDVAPYCGTVSAGPSKPAQVGSGEWAKVAANTQYNPIQVTVAVGWVQGGRSVSASSDFKFTKGGKKGSGKIEVTTADKFEIADNGDGIVTSQAMLSSVITCR